MKYERDYGRRAEEAPPHQNGWDIQSVDPETKIRRYIEVKGKACPWSGNEVVELSRAQVRKAFETLPDRGREEFYLYVVEQKSDSVFEVFPIENPVELAGKWLLAGDVWSMVASERAEVKT